MGMFSAIAKVFGGGKEADTDSVASGDPVVVSWKDKSQPDAPKPVDSKPMTSKPAGGTAVVAPPPGTERRGSMGPNEPVKIDLSESTVKVPAEAKPAKRRAAEPATELVKADEVRDALKSELEDSYKMAISLAEKVDKHLDTQEERSRRLLEIAESLPTALESLGSIGEGQAELRGAVSELANAFRDGQESTQKGLSLQLESLGRVEGLIAEANSSQQEIRSSIENLSSAFTEITESNKRLGDTLTDMKRRDSEREVRLEEANAKTHKLLMGVVIGGAVIGGLAVLALVAQTLVQAGVFGA
ncbi:MAG: hypothetical protein AAFR76_05590 [Planctomycetota bacterium]